MNRIFNIIIKVVCIECKNTKHINIKKKSSQGITMLYLHKYVYCIYTYVYMYECMMYVYLMENIFTGIIFSELVKKK